MESNNLVNLCYRRNGELSRWRCGQNFSFIFVKSDRGLDISAVTASAHKKAAADRLQWSAAVERFFGFQLLDAVFSPSVTLTVCI